MAARRLLALTLALASAPSLDGEDRRPAASEVRLIDLARRRLL